ncbi:MAG: hypothetical protein FGM27_07030 [Candidatus Omnitrophica bacterium]|nr:hypothetical protein [Candidatus Omnitrophota bacterium]
MKIRYCFFLAIVVIAHSGFSWFQPQQQEKKKDQTEAAESRPSPSPGLTLEPDSTQNLIRTSSAPASPRVASDAVKSVSGAAEAVRGMKSAQAAQTPALSVLKGLPPANVDTAALPLARQNVSPLEDLEVIKIQKQISEIIEANEKFKMLQQAQTEQIRQMTEQAQIHRRMLQDLEEKNSQQRDLTTADVDEILRQEKMRIIESETGKNKILLDQIAREQEGSDADR